jgi:hypothetical protein
MSIMGGAESKVVDRSDPNFAVNVRRRRRAALVLLRCCARAFAL